MALSNDKQLTREDIKQLERDAKNERFHGVGSYAKWFEQRTSFSRPSKASTENVLTKVPEWTKVDPAEMQQVIRERIEKQTRAVTELIDAEVDDRSSRELRKELEDHDPRRTRRRSEDDRGRPRPSPKGEDEDSERNRKKKRKGRGKDKKRPPKKRPPKPRTFPSAPDPPKQRRPRRDWSSDVGYFVALQDIGYYPIEPVVYDAPFYDIDFTDRPEQFLTLLPGEEWASEWFSGPVIRGLDINVIGSYQLQYAKNGDFEL